MAQKRKSLRVWILGLVIAAFVVADMAPMFAQAQDTIELAQVVKKKRKTLMDLLFGEPEPEPVVVQPQAPKKKKKPTSTGGDGGGGGQTASLPPAKPAIEKAANALRVAVFGDSMAADLGKALERFYAEDPNLIVIPQGVGSSGFVRADFFDWDKTVGEQIAARSFDVAVVMIGVNDRQTLNEGGKSYKALTDGWSAAYTARIGTFLNQLRAAGKPTIWVGLPPMAKGEYSTAMSQITAIQRLASFSGGAEFLDIYERFVDEEGKYTSYGPDVNGQSVRMRKDDGIHFSDAGADKLAFYLSQSIKNYYGGAGGVEVADPLLGTDAQTMMRLPYQGLGQIRQLEVAGAVVSLSNSPTRAVDLLTASAITPTAATTFSLEDLMMAPVGRVDAFGVGITPEAETETANSGQL